MKVVSLIMIGQTKSQLHIGNLLIKVGKIQDTRKTTIIFHKISSFFVNTIVSFIHIKSKLSLNICKSLHSTLKIKFLIK